MRTNVYAELLLDLTLDKPILGEAAEEIFKPRMAVQLHKPGAFCWFGVSDRRACWVSRQHGWTQRYVP